MTRQRQRDTRPELLVRALLHALGYRFRVANRDLPGSPDIANRSKGWVVFVHGCYWHRHHTCKRATIPKRHRAFWLKKFQSNERRDAEKRRDLKKLGFRVLTVWECECEKPERLRGRLQQLLATP